jgi:hypothetical protein
MRHLLPRQTPPRQRERLRGQPADITVEIQQHRRGVLERHPGNTAQGRRLPLQTGINRADLNAGGTRVLRILRSPGQDGSFSEKNTFP